MRILSQYTGVSPNPLDGMRLLALVAAPPVRQRDAASVPRAPSPAPWRRLAAWLRVAASPGEAIACDVADEARARSSLTAEWLDRAYIVPPPDRRFR